MKHTSRYLIGAAFAVMTCPVWASNVTIPHTFSAGTPAKAAEVNDNFTAVKTAVDDNESQIAALKAQIAALQSQLSKVTSSNVMALDPYLTVDTTSDSRGTLVTFSDVNVQIVNGMGSTSTANGLGNLIIGYDEADTSGIAHCTLGTDPISGTQLTDQGSCLAAGKTWTIAGFKTGSHYLVLGTGNNYSRWGGIVAGQYNTSNYDYADVVGGFLNSATGLDSSVSGGSSNIAGGNASSISAGALNIASGSHGSVSGGTSNIASGDTSSISGGNSNQSAGSDTSVSGGNNNIANASFSSISGGANNTTNGLASSILGGASETADTNDQTIPALP